MKLNKKDFDLMRKYASMNDEERNHERIRILNDMDDDADRKEWLLKYADVAAQFKRVSESIYQLEREFN